MRIRYWLTCPIQKQKIYIIKIAWQIWKVWTSWCTRFECRRSARYFCPVRTFLLAPRAPRAAFPRRARVRCRPPNARPSRTSNERPPPRESSETARVTSSRDELRVARRPTRSHPPPTPFAQPVTARALLQQHESCVHCTAIFISNWSTRHRLFHFTLLHFSSYRFTSLHCVLTGGLCALIVLFIASLSSTSFLSAPLLVSICPQRGTYSALHYSTDLHILLKDWWLQELHCTHTHTTHTFCSLLFVPESSRLGSCLSSNLSSEAEKSSSSSSSSASQQNECVFTFHSFSPHVQFTHTWTQLYKVFTLTRQQWYYSTHFTNTSKYNAMHVHEERISDS